MIPVSKLTKTFDALDRAVAVTGPSDIVAVIYWHSECKNNFVTETVTRIRRGMFSGTECHCEIRRKSTDVLLSGHGWIGWLHGIISQKAQLLKIISGDQFVGRSTIWIYLQLRSGTRYNSRSARYAGTIMWQLRMDFWWIPHSVYFGTAYWESFYSALVLPLHMHYLVISVVHYKCNQSWTPDITPDDIKCLVWGLH
jgi:hypothetical protein